MKFKFKEERTLGKKLEGLFDNLIIISKSEAIDFFVCCYLLFLLIQNQVMYLNTEVTDMIVLNDSLNGII